MQTARLNAGLNELVDALTVPGAIEKKAPLKRLQSLLHNNGYPTADQFSVDRRLAGLVERHRIQLNGDLAKAIDDTKRQLEDLETAEYNGYNRRVGSASDKQGDRRPPALHPKLFPDVLHFLLTLAEAPSSATQVYARSLLFERAHPEEARKTLTWEAILADDPLEGDHWQVSLSYGSDSDESLSSLETASKSSSEEVSLSTVPRKRGPKSRQIRGSGGTGSEATDLLQQDESGMQDVLSRQSWLPAFRFSANLKGPFDLGDPFAVAPAHAFACMKQDPDGLVLMDPMRQRFIDEIDVVRDVVGAFLRGNSNMFVRDENGNYEIPDDIPLVLHLTPMSFRSILSSFIRPLDEIGRLRVFIREMDCAPRGSSLDKKSQTLEAFGEALRHWVSSVERWLAEEEVSMLNGRDGEDRVASLLSLSDAVAKRSQITAALCHVVSRVDDLRANNPRTPHAIIATCVLDTLQHAAHHALSTANTYLGHALLDIFLKAAVPLWRLVGRWMTEGRLDQMRSSVATSQPHIRLSDVSDMFVMKNEDVEMEDPDFYEEGFKLLTEGDSNVLCCPEFMQCIAADVLAAGKAINLLRVLGAFEVEEASAMWPDFSELINSALKRQDRGILTEWEASTLQDEPDSETALRNALFGRAPHAKQHNRFDSGAEDGGPLESMTEVIALSIREFCCPRSASLQAQLRDLIVEKCGLRGHLEAVEGVYLMRRGWTVGQFTTILFDRMDRDLQWRDYSFLNSVFTKAIDNGNWIDSSLVGLRIRSGRHSQRSVKILESLVIEYQVPWPVSFILSPQTMKVYHRIFTFLLQCKRAKHLTDRLSLLKLPLEKGALAPSSTEEEFRAFYHLRRRLSWIVGTLWGFWMATVIQSQVTGLREEIDSASTLSAIIQVHSDRLSRLHDRMLLNERTKPIHRSILSIFDIAISCSDTWSALHSDSPTQVTRKSLVALRRRRQRNLAKRERRKRKKLARLDDDDDRSSEDEDDQNDDDDEDDLDLDDAEYSEAPSFGASSVSFADESFLSRIRRLGNELSGLVDFVKQGVDALASSASVEARESYEILAFRLGDWK